MRALSISQTTMRLESELRVRLQLRDLEYELQQNLMLDLPVLQSGMWIKLWQLPSPFSADEALLLCQCAADQWLAWVPEYGEILLELGDFGELEA